MDGSIQKYMAFVKTVECECIKSGSRNGLHFSGTASL